jgi:hypothetical protein
MAEDSDSEVEKRGRDWTPRDCPLRLGGRMLLNVARKASTSSTQTGSMS